MSTVLDLIGITIGSAIILLSLLAFVVAALFPFLDRNNH